MKCGTLRGSTIVFAVVLVCSSIALGGSFNHKRAIKGVARDIANLKRDFPQLRDFSVAKNLSENELRIEYEYHTHKAERIGGWTSGVPNPDDDGIWFFIDFHDANSTAQIHTQPASLPICIGDKRVTFLSLEGTRTKSVAGKIFRILETHGAKKCRRTMAADLPRPRIIRTSISF